ncbi:MAG: hypothetical protein H6644_19425 [Caldilineaceae bacterium]|nr:hypothetical protein [Caldilineaceae bacterium]
MDVRGRIEWPATIKETPQRRYDRPLRLPKIAPPVDTPGITLLVAFLDLLDAAHATDPTWLRDGTLVVSAAPPV